MNKDLTEIVFILDQSGSMYDMVEDTIGGFNSMIEKQKQVDGKAFVTTVLFNTQKTIIHDRLPIEDIKDMTRKDYEASGSTALIDAIGFSIEHIDSIHKYAREEDVPEKTIFIITTDGLENASHKYTSTQVKQLIEQKKEDKWEFIFLGANIDVVETAASFGIGQDRAANYNNDSAGVATNFAVLNETVCKFRKLATIDADWKNNIEIQYRKSEEEN